MERLKRFWGAFKDIAIVFSFVVNLVLVLTLLVMSLPALRAAFALKAGMVEPLLSDLDAAFVGLGEATIDTQVQIEDEPIHIKFDLPLDQPLGLDFDLPISQETVVMLTRPVPLNRPATFTLYGSGTIRGDVYLELPAGMQLPVRLDMVVPVSRTIPVRMNVPVDQTVPISMTVPVRMKLGEAGLDPAVENLRAVFRPLKEQIERLPDGF